MTPGARGRRKTSIGTERWEFWWAFNREPFLNLRARLAAEHQVSGSADWLLGKKKRSEDRGALRPSKKAIHDEILPRLIAALEDSCHHLRLSAVLSLGKTGDLSVLPKIVEMLGDEHPRVSEGAALAIGILGIPAGAAPLEDVLLDNANGRKLVRHAQGVPYRTRALAAIGLAWIGGENATTTLLRAVEETKRDAHQDVPSTALLALGLMGSDVASAIEPLTEIARDSRLPDTLRAAAVTTLGKIGDPAAIPTLHRFFRHRNNPVRRSAVIALGLLGRPDDTKTVMLLQNEVRKGSDPVARAWACIALGRVGGPIAEKTLKEAVFGKSGSLQTFGAIGLAIYGSENDPASVAKFLRRGLAAARSESTRGAFCIALGIVQDRASEEAISEVLASSKSPEIRGNAAIALGMIKARSASPQLRALLEDANFEPDLQEAAAVALGLLGDREAMAILTDRIELGGSDTGIGSAAIALGLVGDGTAVDTLAVVIDDPSKTLHAARANAASALGMLAEPRLLPALRTVTTDTNYLALVEAARYLSALW